MADRITINFAANTDDVERGADRMNESLKSTQSTLDDVGQAGEDAGGKVQEVGDSAEDSAGKLGGLGQIGTQVLSGDIGGAAQDAAGLLTALGPAATAAGAIAAAGIGLVTQGLQDQQKAADELKKRLADAYKSAIQDGRDFLDEAQIDAAALDILTDTGKRNDAGEAARRVGVDSSTYIRALAGDQQALNYAIDQTQDKISSLGPEIYGRYKGLSEAESVAINTQLAQLKDISQAHSDNADAAQGYADVVAAGAAQEQGQVKRTSDAEVARFQALQAAVEKAAAQHIIIPASIDTSGIDQDLDAVFSKRRRVLVSGTVDQYGRSLT